MTLLDAPRPPDAGSDNAPRRVADLPVADLNAHNYEAIGFMRSVQMAVKRQGPVLRLKIGQNTDPKILLAQPEFGDCWRRHSRALVKDVDEYPAPASLARMILDDNLTTAREGAEWENMRAAVAPLMRYKMTSYATAVDQAANALMDALASDQTEQSLWDLCGVWSAQTVCHPVLGFGFSDDLVLDLVNALRGCMFHLVKQAPYLTQGALRRDAVLVSLRRRLSQTVTDAIVQSRPGDDTMVATLLRSRDYATGTFPSDALIKELQPILIGALAAAVHNNSLAMYWTLQQLAQNAGPCTDIAAEACAIDDLDWHLNNAPVALACVREALRINPVLPFIERRAATDMTLNNIAIPAGATVVFSPWLVQRSAAVWDDPLRYDPHRFVQGDRLDLTRWFPFGLGHRACIGSNLALNQLSRSVSLICCRLHLSMPADTKPSYWQPTYRVLLEPRADGGRLDARPRH